MKLKEKLSCQAEYLKYSLRHKVKKLQIGCGDNIIDGFFNTDINIKQGVSYLDATEPMPFKSNTFHYIFSEHNFEHLTYQEGKLLLNEAYRILKDDGVIRLTMPCLEFLMDIYNNPDKKENLEYMKWHFQQFALEQLNDFGENYSTAFLINNFMRFWGHKCLYDKDTIKRMLMNAGFTDITFCNVSESSHEHLNNIEKHQEMIPAQFNLMETMCVEATKKN